MRCLPVRSSVLAVSLLSAACLAFSGCYTMVAHPSASPADPSFEPTAAADSIDTNAAPVPPHPRPPVATVTPVQFGPTELLGEGIEMTLEMQSARVAYRDELGVWFHLRNPFGFEHWVPFADERWFSYRIESQEMGRVSEGGGRFEGSCIAPARNGNGLWAFVPGYGDCFVFVPIPPADFEQHYLVPGHYRVRLTVPRDLGRTYELEFEIE